MIQIILSMDNMIYCNNCGRIGHQYHQCKLPITSYGIIAFKITKNKEVKYLLIRRKDTLGYVDFIRGKYTHNNMQHIVNMLQEMTNDEKKRYAMKSLNFCGIICGV